jgi:ABC-type sulfate transport system permease subunit
MNQITSMSDQARICFAAFASKRVAALRAAAARGDHGASAIELAIITALIAVAAATVAGIIVAVIGNKSGIIKGL